MSQYFLSLPHDSEEEPTMASTDPAELEQVMARVGALNDALVEQAATALRARVEVRALQVPPE